MHEYDDLFFKKEPEIYYENKDLGLVFKKPNEKKLDVYYQDDMIGHVKIKQKNKDLKQSDVSTVIKLLMAKYDLHEQIIELEACFNEIEGLLMSEPEYNDSLGFVEKLQKNPNSPKDLIRLGQWMKDRFNIIKTEEGDNYWLDGYYKPLDVIHYQDMITRNLGLNLMETACKQSLSSINGVYKDKSYLWEFKDNIYLNTKNYTIIQEEEPQLTSKKFIFDDELLEYDKYVEIFNKIPQTLMEKTLQEILIPKIHTEDNSISMYKDFLYLLGWSFIQGNIGKNIIIYYNQRGNNGKTALRQILQFVFKEHMKVIKPVSFDDNFFDANIDDSNIIAIDELLYNSLDGKWDIIKNMAAGGADDNIRVMYSNGLKKAKGKGTLYLMTNELPNIPLHDEALLWRLLIYELPNRFTEIGDGENEYRMDRNLFVELEKDRDGLEWLINASIKCYLTETFDRPTLNEIKSLIGGADEVKDWIINNTALSHDDVLYNSEIVEFIFDANPELAERLPRQTIAQRVGNELRNVYGAKLQTERSAQGARYNIELA